MTNTNNPGDDMPTTTAPETAECHRCGDVVLAGTVDEDGWCEDCDKMDKRATKLILNAKVDFTTQSERRAVARREIAKAQDYAQWFRMSDGATRARLWDDKACSHAAGAGLPCPGSKAADGSISHRADECCRVHEYYLIHGAKRSNSEGA